MTAPIALIYPDEAAANSAKESLHVDQSILRPIHFGQMIQERFSAVLIPASTQRVIQQSGSQRRAEIAEWINDTVKARLVPSGDIYAV